MRVHEGSQLLGEVDSLVDGDLGSHLLVLLEQVCKSPDNEAALSSLSAIDLQELLVLLKFRELGQEVMKRLDCTWAKYFIKDLDFCNELPSNRLETVGQLGNVCQGNNKIFAQIGQVRVVLKTLDHGSDDNANAILVHQINDVLLAVEVD